MMCVMGFHQGNAFLICIILLIEYDKVTLQASMRKNLVELESLIFICALNYFNVLRLRSALSTLCVNAGSSEPPLFDNSIYMSIKIL